METYSITDLLGYATCIRDAAARSLKEDHNENLDDFISIKEVIGLIRDNSIGFDEQDNFLINEDIHEKLYEDIQSWIFNIGLAKLASSGKIECAWDSEENTMVFWAAEDKQSNDRHKKSTRKNRRTKG